MGLGLSLHNVFRREPVSQPATQSEQHRHVQRWTGTGSAMESLIKLGRRHNNAQPLGPHPFTMPEWWAAHFGRHPYLWN